MEENRAFPIERVNAIADSLLTKLEQAVQELDAVVATHREKVKTETGEQVTEFDRKLPRRKGTVDRGGLKQLTSVLKDLEEILLCMPQMDLREQQARITRLERELQQADRLPEITVTLEGETECYAG